MPVDIDALFCELLALDDVDRVTRLACLDSSARAQVEALLEADRRAEAATAFLAVDPLHGNDRTESFERFTPGSHLRLSDDAKTQTRMPANGRSSVAAPEALFGEYELLDEIARGGMGIVYKARHVPLDRTVAVKTIRDSEFAGDDAVRRFRREAEAAAQLDHPGIVPVYDFGQVQGTYFYAMGLIDGPSLAAKLRQGPLSAADAASLAAELADALQYAHERGVIHRDLKPANVLIGTNGRARITDFGLAKRVETDEHLTSTGAVMGTPSYMSPEQATGREAGPASDVYSLGAVLYELLTGRPPFRAATALETIRQVIGAEPASPRSVNTAVRRDLETICLKCLEKAPERRYASAGELAADLRRFLNGEPIRARPLGMLGRAWRWSRRRPVAAAWLFAILSITVLAAGGGVELSRRSADARLARAQQEVATLRARHEAAERERAEAVARTSRYHALVNQAEHALARRAPGWLHQVLQAVEEAARIDVSDRQLPVLRNLAVQALTSVDFRLRREFAFPVENYSAGKLAMSPDGRHVVVADHLGKVSMQVIVYDVETGKIAWKLEASSLVDGVLTDAWEMLKRGSPDGITGLAFRPDGRLLTAGTRSGRIHVWDLSEPSPAAAVWKAHGEPVRQLVFSRDGECLFTASASGHLVKWKLAEDTGGWRAEKIVERSLGTSKSWGVTLTSSPDGRHLVISAAPDPAALLDAITLDELGRLPRLFQPQLHPGGRLILFSDDSAILCDLATMADMKWAPMSYEHPRFSPRGDYLAAHVENHIQVRELASGRLACRLPTPLDPSFAFGGANRFAVRMEAGAAVYEVDDPGIQEFLLGGAAAPVVALAVLDKPPRVVWLKPPTSKKAGAEWTVRSLVDGASASYFIDGRVDFADEDSRPLGTLGSNLQFAVSDGRRIVVGKLPSNPPPPDPAAPFAVPSVPHELLAETEDLRRLEFHPPTSRLWAVDRSDKPSWRRTLSWPYTDEGVVREPATVVADQRDLGANSPVLPDCWAFGVRHQITGAKDGHLALWPLDGRSRSLPAYLFQIPRIDMTRGGRSLSTLAVLSDESAVLVGTQSGEVALVAVPQLKVTGQAALHDDAVVCLALSSDGQRLASASADGIVKLSQRSGSRFVERLSFVPRMASFARNEGAFAVPGVVVAMHFADQDRKLVLHVDGEMAIRLVHLDRLEERLVRLGVGG